MKKIIVSTDWWTDVDDAVAMRVLVWAHLRGIVEILGMDINTNLAIGPSSLDAFLRYEGYRYCPISKPVTSHVPDGTPSYQTNLNSLDHDVGDIATVDNCVDMYTTLLTAAENQSVEILSIGYLNNLQEVMMAIPALFAAKVSKLWIMGGNWPSGSENNFNRTAQAIAGIQYVLANWSGPIVFIGYEAAVNILSGQHVKGTSDPLATALIDHGSSNGRPSWDPITAAFCFAPDLEALDVTTVRGTAAVAVDGSNTFTTSSAGQHEYLALNGSIKSYEWMLASMVSKSFIGVPH